MWIELSNDIVDHLYGIKNSLDDDAIAINTLFELMIKNKHIVYASREGLKKIQKLNYLNQSNKDYITWILGKYVNIYSCKSILKYKIKVKIEGNIEKKENDYLVPLKYFYDLKEAKLLTEHETDGKFFLEICRKIAHKNLINEIYDIKLENDSFHGANVGTKIKQCAEEGRIAICIVDSDKKMKDSQFGSTYKGGLREFRKIKNNNIILFENLISREKENLFPPGYYALLYKDGEKKFLKILNEFIDRPEIIRYFDIKDGIKYKDYKDVKWKMYYNEVIDKMQKEEYFHLPSREDDKFVCLEGVGDKACNLLCDLLLRGEDDEVLAGIGNIEKAEKIKDIRENICEELPEYIYEEWKDIYMKLFSCGCCVSKKLRPLGR